jgi:hypothetical protein
LNAPVVCKQGCVLIDAWQILAQQRENIEKTLEAANEPAGDLCHGRLVFDLTSVDLITDW